jgi:glutamyl/glutaminyl-tRNA synthetase
MWERQVTDAHVHGWDDPRLLTLSGLRRRGAPAAAINRFCHNVGITRNENVIPMHQLEHFIRDELNRTVRPTSPSSASLSTACVCSQERRPGAGATHARAKPSPRRRRR